MRIFITWSGGRSEQIAQHLHEWLQSVIQKIVPYVSTNDIEKGSRWPTEIAQNLDEIHFGIACVLPENTRAEWLQFESGALSKSLNNKEGRVAPILFGVQQEMLVNNPLSLFQCTKFSKLDMRQLMSDINKAEGGELVKPTVLDRAFEHNWLTLENQVRDVLAQDDPRDRMEIRASQQFIQLEQLAVLAKEQLKSLAAVDDKVSRLTSANVTTEDQLTLISFLDALGDCARAMFKASEEIDNSMQTARQAAGDLEPGLVRRVQGIRDASGSLAAAARRGRESGASVRALRTAMPDMRRAIAAMTLP